MRSYKKVDEKGTIHFKNENGDYHREDGPAIEGASGYKRYCINGRLHREDGPAKIWSDGFEEYYLYGNRYFKDSYDKEILKIKLKRIKNL